MKVLHVIPSISPGLGGPTQVVLNLVSALRQFNIDAEIVTTNDDGAQLLDVSLNQRVEYYSKDSGQSVPVWFLPRFTPPLKEFIFSPALTGWLWKNLSNYDVIDNHYLFSYAPTCAAAIARWKKVPYTVRTMGQLSPWALAQSQLKKRIYTSLIERRNLNHAAVIHCTTPDEAHDVCNFGLHSPLVTLPLGVHLPSSIPEPKAQLRKQYNLPENAPIILFLSRLHHKKRPELLLESLSLVQAKGHHFHLILAGSGTPDYLAHLKNLTASLGLAHAVSFPGLVVDKEKDLLLQGSDLFVLPSFSENFGIAVAEALAAGLPVVLTPGIQIAPDIAAAKAGFVVPGEVGPLAASIAQLLISSELREELGQNGQRLAKERYSWKAIVKDLIPIYKAIAAGEPLPNS